MSAHSAAPPPQNKNAPLDGQVGQGAEHVLVKTPHREIILPNVVSRGALDLAALLDGVEPVQDGASLRELERLGWPLRRYITGGVVFCELGEAMRKWCAAAAADWRDRFSEAEHAGLTFDPEDGRDAATVRVDPGDPPSRPLPPVPGSIDAGHLTRLLAGEVLTTDAHNPIALGHSCGRLRRLGWPVQAETVARSVGQVFYRQVTRYSLPSGADARVAA